MTAEPSTSRILRALRHAWRMTNPWSPVVRDKRDKPVPLYPLRSYGSTPNSAADLPEPTFDAIRARLLTQSREGMGCGPWVLLLLAVAYSGFFVILWRGSPPGARLPWPMLFIIGMLTASAITYRYRIPKIDRGAIVQAMLAESRCPSCAYDLSATAPSADNLTTCPECGAAWVIPHRPRA